MSTVHIAAGERAAHNHQLSASTADTITFDALPERLEFTGAQIEVLSDGAAAIYLAADGSTATVGGVHCYQLPAGDPSALSIDLAGGVTSLSLISSGTPTYAVTKVNWL